MRVERALGSFHEESVQDAFIGWNAFISFWNLYYGTLHFIVSLGALVVMFRRMPERYPLWRNTLAITTGLALVGFAFFPLMPPRLLPARFGFVDTLADPRFEALWSFQSIKAAANSYAAMPSLHIGWAMWSVCVLYPWTRRWWARVLCIGYPVLTLFAIVVTANHFWLDAVGGAAVLAGGYGVARWWTPLLRRRSEDRVAAVDDQGVTGVVSGGGTGEVDRDRGEV